MRVARTAVFMGAGGLWTSNVGRGQRGDGPACLALQEAFQAHIALKRDARDRDTGQELVEHLRHACPNAPPTCFGCPLLPRSPF